MPLISRVSLRSCFPPERSSELRPNKNNHSQHICIWSFDPSSRYSTSLYSRSEQMRHIERGSLARYDTCGRWQISYRFSAWPDRSFASTESEPISTYAHASAEPGRPVISVARNDGCLWPSLASTRGRISNIDPLASYRAARSIGTNINLGRSAARLSPWPTLRHRVAALPSIRRPVIESPIKRFQPDPARGGCKKRGAKLAVYRVPSPARLNSTRDITKCHNYLISLCDDDSRDYPWIPRYFIGPFPLPPTIVRHLKSILPFHLCPIYLARCSDTRLTKVDRYRSRGRNDITSNPL